MTAESEPPRRRPRSKIDAATPNAGAINPSPLGPVLQHLRNNPSRTWSIVITIFGDAAAPRGGSLWLGSLLEIFAGMEIGGGVVRTAMSRLASDEWLQRSRVGRHSYYRLNDKGRASFDAASKRIYGEPPHDWNGRFRLALANGEADRGAARGALERSGFGAIAPGVWIAPLATETPPETTALLHVQAYADAETGRQLAARAWPLAKISEAYQRFLDTFEPLWSWLAAGGRLSDLEALAARTLLVHEYRRVVLRDPLLPPALLPEAWPGAAARRLSSKIYKTLLPGSERWLDQHGQNENGPLPPPAIDLQGRFGAGSIRSGRPSTTR